MTDKCWIILSNDVTPLGIEEDIWVYDDAVKAFDDWCRKFPFAEFEFFEVTDKDEKNEKWRLITRRDGVWTEDETEPDTNSKSKPKERD